MITQPPGQRGQKDGAGSRHLSYLSTSSWQTGRAEAQPKATGSPARPVRDPRRVRYWQLQAAAALLCQMGGILFMALAARLGHASWAFVLVWAPLSMALTLWVLLGLSMGFALRWRDPTLTVPQIAYSSVSAVVCYAAVGPMRGPSLAMACLALVFSIFTLSARQVRWMTGFVVSLYALAMATLPHWQPSRYPAGEELANFIIVLTVLPAFALLAGRQSNLRAKLSRQKTELQRALARLDQQAGQDELTGLLNRRRAGERLQERCAQARRGTGFCVALADLDHFKAINDRWGHAVGDLVLRRFASELTPMLREGDWLARWGGEEFLLLLGVPDSIQASQALERLRQHVESLALPLPDGQTLRFTVSFGLTEYRSPEEGSEAVARADIALYRAKAQGRNRVVTAEPGGPAAGVSLAH